MSAGANIAYVVLVIGAGNVALGAMLNALCRTAKKQGVVANKKAEPHSNRTFARDRDRTDMPRSRLALLSVVADVASILTAVWLDLVIGRLRLRVLTCAPASHGLAFVPALPCQFPLPSSGG